MSAGLVGRIAVVAVDVVAAALDVVEQMCFVVYACHSASHSANHFASRSDADVAPGLVGRVGVTGVAGVSVAVAGGNVVVAGGNVAAAGNVVVGSDACTLGVGSVGPHGRSAGPAHSVALVPHKGPRIGSPAVCSKPAPRPSWPRWFAGFQKPSIWFGRPAASSLSCVGLSGGCTLPAPDPPSWSCGQPASVPPCPTSRPSEEVHSVLY